MTARLQVLYLPSEVDGDRHESRFGLVVDQAGDLAESDREALRAFASELGAQGFAVVSGTLDVVQGDDGEADGEVAEALGEQLRDALSVPAITPPSTEQPKPKLPPPNTTEGKLARTWASKPPEGDPL